MKKCEKCGFNQNPDEAKFCGKCGQKLPKGNDIFYTWIAYIVDTMLLSAGIFILFNFTTILISSQGISIVDKILGGLLCIPAGIIIYISLFDLLHNGIIWKKDNGKKV